jgi:hypothetical protein
MLNTNKQKLLNAFPSYLKSEVEIVIDFLLDKNVNSLSSNEQSVLLDNQALLIPSRIYFDEPNNAVIKELTEIQQTILHCIYLRHHNGYVRQRHLEKLINTTDYFVIPFTFQLLGEYVIEILFILNNHVTIYTRDNYLKFINENYLYWQKTKCRIVSYWNEYYRQSNSIIWEDYIGKKIIDTLENYIKIRTPTA